MRGTELTPAAGAPPQDDARTPGRPGGRRRPGPVPLAIAGLTLLGLGVRLYLLSRPGYLLGVTQYDDGPYFGSALRLVRGALPYRDFIIVQPPGITLLMSPAALLAQVAGTAQGMAAGRILTVAASSAGVLLTGLLLRRRGLLAVTLACGMLAIFPGSLIAAHTVLLEPWLTLFCLAGGLAVLDGDRLATGRRLVAGGLAFGFAGAVEAWAILPVAVLVACCGRDIRRTARFLAGVAAGFAVPVLPFAALAPSRFYSSVIAAQLLRVVRRPAPLLPRLRMMTGLGQLLHLGGPGVLALALGLVVFVAGALLLSWRAGRGPLTALDVFAVGSCALVAAAFLTYPQFFPHFPAFLAPFLAMSAGLAAARLAGTAPATARRAEAAVAAAAALAVLVLTVQQAYGERRVTPRVSPAAIAAVQRMVRPGACVLTDQVSYTIAAGRFYAGNPRCALLVDSIGTDYALGHGRDGASGAARYPAVAAVWREALHQAQYVWLTTGYNRRRIAWTPALRSYFHGHFRPVLRDGRRDVLYARLPARHG
ncbi:MAG: hypothetical protein ACHP9Z_26745 [Streptosporangiales bacterium]